MANEKISDLTTVDRLRAGNLIELEDATNGSGNIDAATLLTGPPFDTTSQILGSSGSTMEVDATTLAARLTARADETNLPQAGWTVSRHSWASSQFYAANALAFLNASAVTAINDGIMLEFAWVNVGGLCVPKKIKGSIATGALGASATAGVVNMKLFRAFGLGPALGTTQPVSFPPSMGGNGVTGETVNLGSTGMKAIQPPSQARIQIVGLNTTAQAYIDANPIAVILGSRIAASSGTTQFQNADLYDYRAAEQPIVLVPGTGLQITLSMPAGATSQQFHAFVNMQWDEWTPVSPGDR